MNIYDVFLKPLYLVCVSNFYDLNYILFHLQNNMRATFIQTYEILYYQLIVIIFFHIL